jgi:hypothetical protein
MIRPAEAGTIEELAPRPAGRYVARPRATRRAAYYRHAAALALYTGLAAIFIDHGESLTGRIAGQGSDPFAFVWFLAWWPWAITHHLNPLFTHLVWQPAGVCLAWVTSVPLLALIGWPLTLISPVLTFNFLILSAPVLSGWGAYFLCLRITRKPGAAIVGGFLFGFSSYEMAQDTAVLNLSFTLCVPLLLLIVLLRLEDGISRAKTVALGGLVVICQFLLCVEIFATIFLFGGIAWGLSMAWLPDRRRALRRLAADGLWTAPLVVLVLSPFLISMAMHAGSINLPALWPYYFVADPVNFLIPSHNNLLGGLMGVATHFNGGVQEQDGYIGLPLLLMIGCYAKENYGTHLGRVLIAMLGVLLVASLGPRLWVAGQVYRLALPWCMFVHLPLLGAALPTRFALFVSLLTAIIAVLWMTQAGTRRQRRARYAMGIAACVFLAPQPHPWMPLPTSPFFQPGRVEAALGTHARLLVLPFSINGPSSFWQQDEKFGFVQTAGYLGFPPRAMLHYPAVGELFSGANPAHLSADVADFCNSTRTQFIVLGPGTTAVVRSAIERLHWPARKFDDVVVYAVPRAVHG